MKSKAYKATKKQWGFFKSLTGDALPAGCSMNEASKLIKQALAGEYQRKPDVVRVYPWRFSGLAAECLKPEMKAIKYAVDINYNRVSSFATLEQAEQAARALCKPDSQIEISTDVREQYMD